MTTWKRGTELTTEDQRAVLAAFVHRYTRDHVPDYWAPNGQRYAVQFASDQEWLERTWFAVRNDGRLDRRVRHSHSEPTWPDGVTTCPAENGS